MSYISVDDLSNEQFEALFDQTARIKSMLSGGKGALRDVCHDNMIGLMFYEPSTRTSGSFIKAAEFLGAMKYEFNIATSSIAKDESLRDTAMMVAMGCDVLVIRHKEVGTCRALEADIKKHIEPSIVVINAGEGTGEHPTQALLDMYTIAENFKRTDVKIGLYGDLAHGRTTHSLIKLASRMGASIACVAVQEHLQMPQEYIDFARDQGVAVEKTSRIEDVIGDLDVVYTTRLQKERINQDIIEKQAGGSGYGLTPELMEKFNPNGVVMHPLPRVDEIPDQIDNDTRAKYFEQAKNGIYTRMALVTSLLGKPVVAAP